MNGIEPTDLRLRVATLVVLVALLAVTLVAAGTIDGTPNYAGNEDLIDSYDAHLGEQAEVDGEVVGTDPVRIELEYGPETFVVTVEDVDESVEEGQHLRVFGTVDEDRTITASSTITRGPWERWYVLGISFLGGLWVLGRFLTGWQFDRTELVFVPRETPLTSNWEWRGRGG